jgi:hypothetical protein
VGAYTCLLATSEIRHVVIGSEYEQPFRDSELKMLDELTTRGLAELEYRGHDGTLVYSVQPPADARRGSVRDCHV